MSQTVVNLGYVLKNRGEYIADPETKYYKDNVVQYLGSAFIADPVGYDPETNPLAYVTGAPYDTDPNQLNEGWKVFASDAAYVNSFMFFTENPEWAYVVCDSEDKILFGAKQDGEFYFGAGCPPQIKEYIDQKIQEASPENYEQVLSFLDEYLGGDKTLQQLLNEKLNSEGLDPNALGAMEIIDNPEWIDVKTDSEDKILEGIKQDGTKVIGGDLQVNGNIINDGIQETLNTAVEEMQEKVNEMLEDSSEVLSCFDVIDNSEYLQVTTDAEGRVLGGRDKDGAVKEYVKIETPLIISDTLSANVHYGKRYNVIEKIELSDNAKEKLKEDLDIHFDLDDFPTIGSSNPVKSNGIAVELQNINDFISALNNNNIKVVSILPSEQSPAVDGTPGIVYRKYSHDYSIYEDYMYNSDALRNPIKIAIHNSYDAPIIPDFSVNNDADAINAAMQIAQTTGNNHVYVPYKEEGYEIDKPIQLLSMVKLEVDRSTIIRLADGVNAPMIKRFNSDTADICNNASVIGGIWDGNCENQELYEDDSTHHTYLTGMAIFGVENLLIEDVTIKNCRTYAIMCGRTKNIRFNKLNCLNHSDVGANHDGIHLLGRNDGVWITNCYIESEDNCIALNANDDNHGVYHTTGPIKNVFIDNIYINNENDNQQGIRILSGTQKIDNINITNINGKASYLIVIDNWGQGPGYVSNVNIKDVNFEWVKRVYSYNFITISVSEIKNLTIEGVKMHQQGNKGWGENNSDIVFKPFASNDVDLSVRNIVIKDCVFEHPEMTRDVSQNKPFITRGVSLIRCAGKNIAISGINDGGENQFCIPVYLENTTLSDVSIKGCKIDSLTGYGWVHLNSSVINKLNMFDLQSLGVGVNGITKVGSNSSISIVNVHSAGNHFYGINEVDDKVMDIAYTISRQTEQQLKDNIRYFNAGQHIYTITDNSELVCTSDGCTARSVSAWEAGVNVARGKYMIYNNILYVCAIAGTTGSEFSPDDNDVPKFIVTDGSAVWNRLYNIGGILV